jgi:hypothetical protein
MSFIQPLTNAMGYNNPADSAMPYLNGIQGQMGQYYNPYIQMGNNAINPLMQQYSSLMNDPSAKMNQIGASFQQSPGYQFNMNQAMAGSNSAAAAGGMLGTPQNQQQDATLAHNLSNQDYSQYMDRGVGMYNQGLQGMNGMMQTGYNASNQMAQALANSMMSQAGMAYAGANNQNAANQGMLGNLASLAGGISSFF